MNGFIPNRLVEGKVAIVTGGASGFGESTVRLFAKHGAKVLITDVQMKEDMLFSDVKNAVDTAISEFGKLDIIFNNAGIPGNIEFTILNADNENFKRVLDVNVYGSFLGAKHATRVMIPAKCGVILFTSSSASVVSGEAPHAYTVSKHAVVGLMKNLCVELGQHGIRVNCISPGSVSTPFLTNAMGLEKAAVDDILCQSAVLKGWCLRRRMWRRRRCF
ncbi:putative secoisolariciresinol dehydrogenase [Helianthus annuus]|nr:putative secoisolariciresinol dehydrogenase [Helianthus annuus]